MRGFNTGGKRRAASALSVVILLMAGLLGLVPATTAQAATASVEYTILASSKADGTQPAGASPSNRVTLSANGEYAAFVSAAPLVAADTNGFADVYRKNTSTGAIDLVTTGANGSSTPHYVAMSDDGAVVVFSSDATNIVPGDVNGATDIFRKNMSTGAIDLVNISNDETEIGTDSQWFSVSADGSKVAFFSSTGLDATVPGVYIRDNAGNTVFAHDATPGPVAISGDGNTVVYQWDTPASSAFEIYLTDLNDTAVNAYLLHFGMSGNNADPVGLLGPDSISHDGDFVAFWSDGNTYPPGPSQARPRSVYWYDHEARKAAAPFYTFMKRVSEGPDGPDADTDPDDGNADSAGGSVYPKGAITADGTKVAFATSASNLAGGTGGLVVKTVATGAIQAHSLDNSYAVQAVRDGTISPTGSVVGFSTNAAMRVTDTNGVDDVWTRSTSAPTTPPAAAPANLSLTVETGSTLPGFSLLESADVPPTALPLDALGDVAGTPLRSIDLASTPLRSIPLRSIPLRSIPLRSIPLRSITLSELPLAEGTWEAILATIPGTPYEGVPLQAISLDQVLAANPPALGDVTLGDVDLASTPLRSISVTSILLGSTPLRSIPVEDPNELNSFSDWCAVLAGLGFSCADLGLTENSSLLAVDLAGVPLRSIPLRSIPLRSIPLRSIDVESAPLRSIPLRSIVYGGELGAMPLSAIRDSLPDGASNPGLLINCAALADATCAGKTLTDATNADAFIEGKTLGDLIDHVNDADITGSLGDLIAAVIDSTNYPWEELPLDGLQPYAGEDARTVEYNASFDVTGAGSGTAIVSVDLPDGFRYEEGSTDNLSDGTDDEPILVEGEHIEWMVPVISGESYSIPFRAYPGFELAVDATSVLTVEIGDTGATTTGQAPVDVFQDFEFVGGPVLVTTDCSSCFLTTAASFSSPIIQPNTIVASHIGYSGDEDWFRIPVPPKGTRLQVRLGNHSTDADFDVAMFNGTESTPLRSIPLRSIPLRSIPLSDNGIDATAAEGSVSPETLNDIPNTAIAGTPLRSIGENRGQADELIVTTSNAEPIVYTSTDDVGSPQYYDIQVTAYNGGSSNSPYVLYVSQYTPPPPPACPAPKAFAFAGQGSAGTAPTLPTDLNTLILVNQERLGDTYGSAEAANVMTKLDALAGASGAGVIGAAYPVESDPEAATNYGNWDANPCSVENANAVFTEVASIVDSVKAARPTLKNVVVIGGDDIIPMARVADYTQISNESDYGNALLLSSGTNRGTPLASSAITQNILTDDPLGDLDPIPWLDHALYVPDMAVGRVVETPGEIAAQVDMFIAANGQLDPQTSLTMGYDFLSDGAEAVDNALGGGIEAAKRTKIINETWAKGDVLAALYPSGGTSPDIATVNAHYDHNKALPALGNSTGDESDLVTAEEIAANPLLTKRLLFTMGCHGGLSVPKSYTDTAAKDVDWAQTYSGEQAAVYLANTGFGYGDTAAVALSEELMKQFASRLDGSMTVGEAAVYAKQAYFGQLGAYGPYDEKAMQEATLYGLPMWSLGGAITQAAAPAPIDPAPDADGVESHSLTLDPTFQKKTSKGGGTFFDVSAPNQAASGLQVTQYRPIQPRVSVDVTPISGVGSAHGVLITDLESSDQAVVPAMARPVIDLSANEPAPPAGDVSFPTTFQNLTSFNTPDGPAQHVVFMPGQFFRDASWNNAGGVQRLFDSIESEVKYSTSTDFTAPHLTNVVAELVDGELQLSLTSYDLSGSVVRVLVLVKDGTGAWHPVELVQDAEDTTLWTGSIALPGTDFEYFAQAMDSNGNVGVTTNKGRYYTGLPELLNSGTPDLTLTPGQPTGSNGWFNSGATVSLIGNPQVTYTVTKSFNDGAPSAAAVPQAISADGSYLFKAVGSDGSSDSLTVAIDKTAPSVQGLQPDRQPNQHGWYNAPVIVSGSCSDATSGVQFCPGGKGYVNEGANQADFAFDFAGNKTAGVPINIDYTAPSVTISGVEEGVEYQTMPAITCTVTDALSGPDGCTGSLTSGAIGGNYIYTAVGKDKAGNTTVKQVSFKVKYVFSGFLQPINDTAHNVDQTHSVFAAGSTVPFRFQLTLDGQPVQAGTTPVFLTPQRLGPLSGGINETGDPLAVPSSGFDFSYDGQKYSYGWKTKKSDKGYYYKVGVLLDGVQYTVIIGLK